MSIRAAESFERKVRLLEEWALAGAVPPGEVCPKGPAELARWEDASRGLTRWISPNITAPSPSGRYPELRARFDRAVAVLCPSAQKRSDNQHVKAQLRALSEQVATLANENRRMGEALVRERQLKQLAEARLAEATAELARLVPFR